MAPRLAAAVVLLVILCTTRPLQLHATCSANPSNNGSEADTEISESDSIGKTCQFEEEGHTERAGETSKAATREAEAEVAEEMNGREDRGSESTAVTVVASDAASTAAVREANAKRFRSFAFAGDSITTAFNGQSKQVCPNGDQWDYSWASSVSADAELCSTGSEGVYSLVERMACTARRKLDATESNYAKFGARVLTDFYNQSSMIVDALTERSGPHLTVVLLGHNDVCGGLVSKTNEPEQCKLGPEVQDPLNYCRTRPAAFERELRKGLDLLIAVPDNTIAVSSLVRLSQMCTFRDKKNCQISFGENADDCKFLWGAYNFFTALLVNGEGICTSLTATCDETRVQDAYKDAKLLNDILQRVATEYAQVGVGEPSASLTLAGEDVGGVTKAKGVAVTFSDAAWHVKVSQKDISCCDCIHLSPKGLSDLADVAFNGLQCAKNKKSRCCAETGVLAKDSLCSVRDKSDKYYRGLL